MCEAVNEKERKKKKDRWGICLCVKDQVQMRVQVRAF